MTVHALALGVNHYRDPLITPLKCCERDAQEVAGLLKHGFGFAAHYLEERMTEEIEQRIEDLGAGLKPGDAFVFYFSGHGKAHAGDHYLLLPGARLAAFESGAVVASGVLSWRNLKHLTSGPAWQGVQRLFIVDACRAPLVKGKAGELPVCDAEYLLRGPGMLEGSFVDPTEAGLTQLNACALGASAVELPGEGHGIFTASLLELLQKRRGEGPALAIDGEFVAALGETMAGLANKSQLPGTVLHQPVLVGEGVRLFAGNVVEEVDDDQTEWAIAKAKRSVEALEAYVRRRPPGKHRADALEMIAALSAPPKATEPQARTEQPQPPAATTPPVRPPQEPTVAVTAKPVAICDPAGVQPPVTTATSTGQSPTSRQAWPPWLKGVLVLGATGLFLAVLLSRWKMEPPAPASAPAVALSAVQPTPRPAAPAAAAMPTYAPLSVFRDKLSDGTMGPEMVVIPVGQFDMGSNDYDEVKPIHRVKIGTAFALGKTEVTQAQWRQVMGNSPSYFKNCDGCPVENVSWHDIQDYITKLKVLTGKRYRLPSEAEWEYAAKAGGTFTYAGGNDVEAVAWYSGNSGGKTHRVGQKEPNAWGLHDMSGNVWETVEDVYRDGYRGAPDDGSAWVMGGDPEGRVMRGGASISRPDFVRPAIRLGYATMLRGRDNGFRLARMLP